MITYIDRLIPTELSNEIISEMHKLLDKGRKVNSDASPFSFSGEDDIYLSRLLINGLGTNTAIFNKIANLAELNDSIQVEINEQMPHFFVYEEGNFIGAHSDVFNEATANCISVVFYFNDDYFGGELVIYDKTSDTAPGIPRGPVMEEQYQVAKFKPKAGSMVAFPHAIMHEALVVNSGRKYICTMMYKIS